jgi:pimeloyl-ACP methyl ester carboxylesterase
MRRTCSSIISLLIGCAAAVGCSLNAPHPYTGDQMAVLEDARFASANARTGVWMPWKFQQAAGRGIYFLDSHDDSKIPVLFIHGMYGSPRDFRYLINRLDRMSFEPWVYYYPSGASLLGTAEHLLRQIDALCAHYDVRSIIIVAHSMGGLIARDILLRMSRSYRTAVPVLITLSTPWDGHRAAGIGARFWPTAVGSWHDLAARSPYIEALFETKGGSPRHLPVRTEHHLFASLGRSKNRGAGGDDQVVSVSSQLRAAAWMDSYRICWFDETHVGILNSTAVANSINRTLATVLASPARDILELQTQCSLNRAE